MSDSSDSKLHGGGLPSARLDAPRDLPTKPDSKLHGMSLGGTIVIGGAMMFALLKLSPAEAAVSEPAFKNAVVIEASLAFKKKTKKRQPQKRKRQVRKPKTQKVSRDENAVVPDEPKKDEPPEQFDPASVLDMGKALQDDDSNTGSDDPEQEIGTVDGSEWGTDANAKGDPYVGELHGRVKKGYSVAAFEKQSASALGCVKLDDDGKIIERNLFKRSKSAVLNSAVEEQLRLATDMDKPVPPHLKTLLIQHGICFKFNLDS